MLGNLSVRQMEILAVLLAVGMTLVPLLPLIRAE